MAPRLTAAWLGTFMTNLLVVASNVVTGIVAARLLLPEGRGILAAMLFWPEFFSSLGSISLEEAVAQRVAADRSVRTDMASTVIWLSLALGVGTLIVLLPLLPIVLGMERRSWWLVAAVYAAAHVPLRFVRINMPALDHGRLRFAWYNVWRLLPALAYLCGLLAIWSLDVVNVTAVIAVAWLAASLTALLLLARSYRDLRGPPSWELARRLLRVGYRFHITNTAFLVGSHIDRLIVMLLWDDVAIGLYAVALTWASTGLNTVTLSFQTVMFPHLSAEMDVAQQRMLLAKGLQYATLLLLLGTVAPALATPWLLPLFFGSSFEDAVWAAIALLLAQFPFALRQIVVRGLRGLDRARPGTIAELLAAGAFVLTFWPLSGAFGLAGMGVALLVGNSIAFLYLERYLRRTLELSIAEWWVLDRPTLSDAIELALSYLRSVRRKSHD